MSGKIITVAQQKGGSGKTTIAAHLAVALSRLNGRSVALLDVDPQGSLGEWFEARERRLGADAAGFGFRTASGWGARREALAMQRDHDFVVVDTPPKSDLEAKPAIEAATLVVVPIQPTPVDFWSCTATLKIVAAEKAPALVVVNRVTGPRTGDRRDHPCHRGAWCRRRRCHDRKSARLRRLDGRRQYSDRDGAVEQRRSGGNGPRRAGCGPAFAVRTAIRY